MKRQNHFLLLFLFSQLYQLAQCQPVNDDIEDRIKLYLNKEIISTTTDCTLQWNCLNQGLTYTCIQYHNDQWFFFKTGQQNTYYLNVSGQECRDLRGVQILVIDGIPCQPESYQVISCISLGNHDDVFIELDSLGHNRTYLVLVDGYLHDFCTFQLEFSDTPKGMPLANQGLIDMSVNPIAEYRYRLGWIVPDSAAHTMKSYEVYRRHESKFKSSMIHVIPKNYNAYGEPKHDYVLEDSLTKYGMFHYTILGVGEGRRTLISRALIQIPEPESSETSNDWLELRLDYPKSCKLKISVYDNKGHSLLYWTKFNYTSDENLFEYYIKDYISEGISSFRIEVLNLQSNEKKNYILLK